MRTGNEPGPDGTSRQGAPCLGLTVLRRKRSSEPHSLSKGKKRGPGLEGSPAPCFSQHADSLVSGVT